MARGSTYAAGQYGQLDAAVVALVAEILAWDARADVRRNAAVVALAALTRCWPASHYPKRERDRWSHKATAAFRASERELAEAAGLGVRSAHTAITKMLDAGFVVELAPVAHRGEGRGSKPPTYALRCHAKSKEVSSETKGADGRRPAQTWSL